MTERDIGGEEEIETEGEKEINRERETWKVGRAILGIRIAEIDVRFLLYVKVAV